MIQKEYKGRAGGKLTIDDNKICLNQLLMKDVCSFADLVKVELKEKTALVYGSLEIYTKKYGKTPFSFSFLPEKQVEFTELYNYLIENMPQENLSLNAFKSYNVLYLGGDDNNPKRTYNVTFTITNDSFTMTCNLKDKFNDVIIPFSSVIKFEIAARTVSSVEGLLGGINSRQLNQDNNIHIIHLNADGDERLIRLEMISGITVMGQAGKCRELMDYLRTSNILPKFAEVENGSKKEVYSTDYLGELEKLAELKERDIITQEEFDLKKKQLLGL